MKVVIGRGPMSDRMDALWGRQGSYWQAYDWTIYCVGGTGYPPDYVIEHEKIHFHQQDAYPGGVDAWWERYLYDEEFRLDQEAQAYANDVISGYRSFQSAVYALTSPLYGGLRTSQVQAALEVYLTGRDAPATMGVKAHSSA